MKTLNKFNFKNEVIDRIMPSLLDNRNPAYLLVDGLYYSGMIIVDYPRIIEIGLLEKLLYLDSNIQFSMFLEKINSYEVIKKLTYHIGNVNTDMKMSSGNKQDYEVLNITYNDAKEIRKELQINNEKIYNVYMYISIYEDSLDKLKDSINKIQSILYSYGLIGKVPYFRHIYLYKSCLPFNINSKEIKYNSKRNMISKTVSSFYPFISCSVSDMKGILYGYNIQNKSLIIIDRFDSEKYINSNICVFGASGSGKSYFTKLQVIRNSLLNTKQFVIDPEGEYKNICKKLNGTYIKLGNNTNTYINIFDIYEHSNINNENIGYLQEKIQNLNIFFSIVFPDLDIESKNYLEEKIIQIYQDKGITFDNKSLYERQNSNRLIIKPKFKSYDKMPRIQDLYDVILKENTYPNLIYLLKPFIFGSLQYFNNYTNVDKENNSIFIDTSDVKDEYMNLSLFVIIEFFWNIVKQDNLQKKIIYIDEIWRLISSKENDLCANFVIQIFKTIRKYKGGATAITQDISDLIINQNVYGKAIINNSSIKAIFKLNEENISELKNLIYISENEKDRILNLLRGECLLIINKNNILLNVSSSEFEKDIIENKDNLERIDYV
ncbi:MAG: DUF87 domain-containing protein [Clostridiales bacterium]|nr:DUF87 domain-containing protein [Clostridiales bacterium]